jgi:cytochrome b561
MSSPLRYETTAAASASSATRVDAPPRYSRSARNLHWLIVALLAIQYITAVLLPHIGRNTPMSTTINLHFSFGVIIVVVTAVRLVQRLTQPVALDSTYSPAWERGLARFVHLVFYALLLIVPFLGWASASAHNLPVSLFGVIPLPALAAPKAGWALTAGDIHTYAMWTLLGLIGVHAAAALFHYYVRRDRVLQSMLPRLG